MATVVGSTQTRSSSPTSGAFQANRSEIASLSASAPGRFIPTDWRPVHAEVRPIRHCSHSKQATLGSMTTLSPMRASETPSPTASMTPNASCPMIHGYSGAAHLPLNTLWSDPQMPTPSTEIRTSPGPGSGSGTSRISMRPGSTSTAAFIP